MKKVKMQREEIIWNIVNSLLAGSLVFLGSLTGGINWQGILCAFIASAVVAITKFKSYWEKEEKEYCAKVFNFI